MAAVSVKAAGAPSLAGSVAVLIITEMKPLYSLYLQSHTQQALQCSYTWTAANVVVEVCVWGWRWRGGVNEIKI